MLNPTSAPHRAPKLGLQDSSHKELEVLIQSLEKGPALALVPESHPSPSPEHPTHFQQLASSESLKCAHSLVLQDCHPQAEAKKLVLEEKQRPQQGLSLAFDPRKGCSSLLGAGSPSAK